MGGDSLWSCGRYGAEGGGDIAFEAAGLDLTGIGVEFVALIGLLMAPPPRPPRLALLGPRPRCSGCSRPCAC